MSTVREQLAKPFVGNLVELYTIDLTPIGGGQVYRFTPSSSTPVQFNTLEYTPFPIQISGQSRDMNNAPGRVDLSISNINNVLRAHIVSLGDIVGARVTHIRTFENFLDGQPDGGTNQSFPIMRYTVFQKKIFNKTSVAWVLTTELDRPDLMLPRRQCLKSDVGEAVLYCPGMQRTRL